MYGDEKRRTLLPHRKPCGSQLKSNKPVTKRPVVANIVTAKPIASEKIVLSAAAKPAVASNVVPFVAEKKIASVPQHYDAFEPFIGDDRRQEPVQPQVRGQRRIPDFGLRQDVSPVHTVRDDSVDDTSITRASDWWPMRGGLSSEDGPGAWWNTTLQSRILCSASRIAHIVSSMPCSISWIMASFVFGWTISSCLKI